MEEIFDELNVRIFDGLLARPALGWSRRRSRTSWATTTLPTTPSSSAGSWMPPTSRAWLWSTLLYHEMLHLRFPIEHHGARRSVHGPQLRQAEREFPGFKEAKRLIKSLPY